MSNPVLITLLANTWIKVASGVTTGQISMTLTSPQQLLSAYRVAGDVNVPTETADGIAMSRKSNRIQSRDPIDVYIFSQNVDGEIRVDL